MGYNVHLLLSEAEALATIKCLEGSGEAALGHVASQLRREMQQERTKLPLYRDATLPIIEVSRLSVDDG